MITLLTDKHKSFNEIRRMYPDKYIGVADVIEIPDNRGVLTFYGVIVCRGNSKKEVRERLKGLNCAAVLSGKNLLNIERIGLSVITA